MYRTINKRGSMLMMVMIMLIVAAIVAMKLMPDEQTQVVRENEALYNSELSQLREAIDMVRLASRDPNSRAYFNPDNPESTPYGWRDFSISDTPETIEAKLASLTEWEYLRKSDLKDNSVPEFQWGTGSSKIYWLVSTNYASNTSFEIVNNVATWPDSWEFDSNTASPTMVSNIHLNSMAIDEYPYQNKLGNSNKGPNSIQMIRLDD